jgi:ribonuclease HI
MIRNQVFQLYVDGAAKGNPGEAGIGVILQDGDDNILLRWSEHIGRATNNQAEYMALIVGLKKSLAIGVKEVVVYTDSELMERQITGQYRVKDKTLRSYHSQVCQLLESLVSYHIVHIPRGKNREADRLASKAATGIKKSGVRNQR